MVILTRDSGGVPPPPPTGLTVTSITDMLAALRNPANTSIILANGTYSGSLDIDASAYGAYTRDPSNAVIIRAETDGGVTIDGGGGRGPLTWVRGGCAYQEWRGFKYGNVQPWDGGVIGIGEGNGVPNHHITFRNIEFLSNIHAGPGPNSNYTNGQGFYLSWASGAGNHDILVDGFLSNAEVWSHVHIYHDESGHVTGHDNIIRNATLNCTGAHGQMGIVPWSASMTDFLFEDIAITGANEWAVRHNTGGTATFRRVVSTGSGTAGIYSNLGSYPNIPGLIFESCSFA